MANSSSCVPGSMTRFSALIGCAVLVAASAVFCQEAAPQASDSAAFIEHCAHSVERSVVGLEALEAQCPGLERALVESKYSAFLL